MFSIAHVLVGRFDVLRRLDIGVCDGVFLVSPLEIAVFVVFGFDSPSRRAWIGIWAFGLFFGWVLFWEDDRHAVGIEVPRNVGCVQAPSRFVSGCFVGAVFGDGDLGVVARSPDAAV